MAKGAGRSLHVCRWLWSPIVDAQTLRHFRQLTALAEDDWEAARFLFLLRLCFAALCLSSSGTYDWLHPVKSTNCLGLRPTAAMIDGCSHLCKLSLQPLFVTLSGATTFALSFLELAEEDCFWHAYVFHPCDVASPAEQRLKQDRLYSGQAGCLEDFFV